MTRLLSLGLVASLLAPGLATAACTAIVAARAYLPDGPRSGVTVVIDGDQIVAVGADVSVPAGCKQIDGRTLVLTPGLIEPWSQLGLVEVGLEADTRDFASAQSEESGSSLHPSFRVADAYNPGSTLVPITRVAGVTSTVSAPSEGLISGVSAWVDLAGATQREAVRRRELAMHASVRGSKGSRASQLHAIRGALLEARIWAKRRGDWEKGQSRRFRMTLAGLEALQPVLNKTIPLVISTDRAADIEATLRLAKELDIRVVIQGGAEAWLHSKSLGKRKVPVIVDPLLFGPSSFGSVRARPDNAALLAAAGVPVMLGTFWTHNTRTLAQVAGNAVRAGLPHAAAIRALTLTPAEVFGMPKHGRLSQGARANVVVWSGDPLELSTRVLHLFIGGRAIPLVNRQTRLRDRYLDRAAPKALPLPSP